MNPDPANGGRNVDFLKEQFAREMNRLMDYPPERWPLCLPFIERVWKAAAPPVPPLQGWNREEK